MSGVHQTISRLRELRLTSMAEAYSVQLQQPKLHQLSFDDRFGLLVEHEASERDSKKLKRLVRSAGFPESASLKTPITELREISTKGSSPRWPVANGFDSSLT